MKYDFNVNNLCYSILIVLWGYIFFKEFLRFVYNNRKKIESFFNNTN